MLDTTAFSWLEVAYNLAAFLGVVLCIAIIGCIYLMVVGDD